VKHHGTDTCVMREDHVGKPADHGLMCEECRAEDRAIHANDNRPRTIFSDDVDPAAGEENHVEN
jgi:hypothetical protein